MSGRKGLAMKETSPISNTRIDRAGRALAKDDFASSDDRESANLVLNEYRRLHLEPLTSAALQLQRWMDDFGQSYYIAHRLKRKPQIVRKLRRLTGRLTQLQDIAGARIVLKHNDAVDQLRKYLQDRAAAESVLAIDDIDDYRVLGREDSGYRALHIVFLSNQRRIELQLRSEAQHYWAEQIERSSVIYGYHLKELEGDEEVLRYFKTLSDIFYELESGREPSTAQKILLEEARLRAVAIIRQSDKGGVLNSKISEGVVKAMISRHSRQSGQLTNWILVFDWNTGSFVHFEPVDRNPTSAMDTYIEKEDQFPVDDGFEVVMIGSSDPHMIRHTHSHYFGIESYDSVLENLRESVAGISRKLPIGIDALKILRVLVQRKNWSKAKMINRSTLKNHFCQSVVDFDTALTWLAAQDMIILQGAGVYLNIQQKASIESYL